MTWEPFTKESSNIASTRYDADNQILEITFKNGGIYQYYNVPNNTWIAFKGAESLGKYLAASIKGHFKFSKV